MLCQYNGIFFDAQHPIIKDINIKRTLVNAQDAVPKAAFSTSKGKSVEVEQGLAWRTDIFTVALLNKQIFAPLQ